jgi:p70 ribosomal S6 kinase
MESESDSLNDSFEQTEFSKSVPFGASTIESDVVETIEEGNEEDNLLVNVQIGPQHFDLLKLIGEGAFGKVLLVRNRLNKQMCAMKVISKKLLKKKNNILYMKSERDILTKVQHPFIVSLYFAFQSESKVFLVMDFLSGGELFYHLKRRGIILEKEVVFYMAEMIVAIDFLHNKGLSC